MAVIASPRAIQLVNMISGEERMIVSDIAGTTRDATDTYIENELAAKRSTWPACRQARVDEDIERYSVIRPMATDRSDVCVLMIDAQAGYTEQDSKLLATPTSRARPR